MGLALPGIGFDGEHGVFFGNGLGAVLVKNRCSRTRGSADEVTLTQGGKGSLIGGGLAQQGDIATQHDPDGEQGKQAPTTSQGLQQPRGLGYRSRVAGQDEARHHIEGKETDKASGCNGNGNTRDRICHERLLGGWDRFFCESAIRTFLRWSFCFGDGMVSSRQRGASNGARDRSPVATLRLRFLISR